MSPGAALDAGATRADRVAPQARGHTSGAVPSWHRPRSSPRPSRAVEVSPRYFSLGSTSGVSVSTP